MKHSEFAHSVNSKFTIVSSMWSIHVRLTENMSSLATVQKVRLMAGFDYTIFLSVTVVTVSDKVPSFISCVMSWEVLGYNFWEQECKKQ